MKATTNFTIFAAVTMMLGFAMTSEAQVQSSSDHIAGNATVVAQVAVSGTQPLEFGNVNPGVVKTISTAGGVVAGTAGGGPETEGKFHVVKGPNTQLTLTWTLPAVLTKSIGGAATMPITFADYATSKCGSVDVSGSLVPFTPGPALPISSANFNAAFVATSFDVHLGGTVQPITAQTAGAYTANITLVATYN